MGQLLIGDLVSSVASDAMKQGASDSSLGGSIGGSLGDAAVSSTSSAATNPMMGIQSQAWDMFSQMFGNEQARIKPLDAAAEMVATPAPPPSANKPTDASKPADGTVRELGGNSTMGGDSVGQRQRYDAASDSWINEFANGGQVPQNDLQKMFPQNIWAQSRSGREQNAGLAEGGGGGAGQGITINVNTSAPSPTSAPAPVAAPASGADVWKSLLEEAKKQGYANGTTAAQPRNGYSDVKAGGKIRGPQSKDGQDNQYIKVAGGEGILPVDVMQVPGVPELVQGLIQHFHTPVPPAKS